MRLTDSLVVLMLSIPFFVPPAVAMTAMHNPIHWYIQLLMKGEQFIGFRVQSDWSDGYRYPHQPNRQPFERNPSLPSRIMESIGKTSVPMTLEQLGIDRIRPGGSQANRQATIGPPR
jgi:hypothetical protein